MFELSIPSNVGGEALQNELRFYKEHLPTTDYNWYEVHLRRWIIIAKKLTE